MHDALCDRVERGGTATLLSAEHVARGAAPEQLRSSGRHALKADPTRSARKNNPVRTYILNMEPDAPTKPPKRKRLRSLKDLIDSLPETQFLKEHGMIATTEKHRMLVSPSGIAAMVISTTL